MSSDLKKKFNHIVTLLELQDNTLISKAPKDEKGVPTGHIRSVYNARSTLPKETCDLISGHALVIGEKIGKIFPNKKGTSKWSDISGITERELDFVRKIYSNEYGVHIAISYFLTQLSIASEIFLAFHSFDCPNTQNFVNSRGIRACGDFEC